MTMSNDELVAYQKGRTDGLLEYRLEIDRLKNVIAEQYQLIARLREEVETIEKDRDHWWNNAVEWELDYHSVLHENDRLLSIITQEGLDETES